MSLSLRIFSISILVIALYLGVRYVSAGIHYGCHNPVPVVDPGAEDDDDCPPPFVAAGKLGWFLTGGSAMPLWNRDATEVDTVSWNIEQADTAITSEDDYRFYEQKIAADVTFKDGTTKRYDLGTAYGCTGDTTKELSERKLWFGRVDCYFALSSTTFAAFNQNDEFRIERYDESAKDGSITTTVLTEIK